jgi:two-component sensor histidine kinase
MGGFTYGGEVVVDQAMSNALENGRQISDGFTSSNEADHRIANSLAVISGLVRVRARADQGHANETFLLEIADRIDTVAKLHRLIAHPNSDAVELHIYLQEICQRLGSALATTAAPSFSVSCPLDQTVPFNVAMPLGLITAELFSNSLKYAHPTGLPAKISVSCNAIPGDAPTAFLFTYEDDGVGFPEGFDISSDGNLGMRFIRSLSEQLQGAQNWTSDPLGIHFELSFRCELPV